jgi:uncharacterized protein involved in response to NO
MNAAMRVRGTGRAWHWRHLWLAPHRLGFFMAMLVLAASAVWWTVVQLQRSGAGPQLSFAVSPSLVHATVMTFGFMPLFFSGFLFTAGPKWLGVPAPSAHAVAPALLAQLAGWFAWLVGSHLHQSIAVAGLTLALAGLCRMTAIFLRLVTASREPDKVHAKAIGVALLVGCASLGGVAIATLTGDDGIARRFVHSGLWGFVVVVFLTVANRMIPFFTSSATQMARRWGPEWVLWLMWCAAAFEVAMAWGEPWLGGLAGWQIVRGLFEFGAGAAVVALGIAWGLMQSLKIRLLAMLHLGLLWLGLALMLSGVSQFLGWMTGARVLPLAGLHALTMGCLGSLMVAMVTRVSCGHSGRALVADNLVWGMFWLLQVATLLRIAATVPGWWTQNLLTATALVWSMVVLAWAIRYGSWYGRPRADGRPG